MEHLPKDPKVHFSQISPTHIETIYLGILTLLFLIIVLPFIPQINTDVSGSRDEVSFHYNTVISFLDQFPELNLRDYPSATTPLYHILLTLASFIIGNDLIALRIINLVLSLICLLVVYQYLARRGGNWHNAFCFSLIFLVSPYFIRASIMLFTDNVALLFTFLALMMLGTANSSRRQFFWANVFILSAVLTRQVYAWLIGVAVFVIFQEMVDNKFDFKKVIKSALPVLIPTGGLFFFVFLWGGLTPLRFQGEHEAFGLNWDVPVYILSLLGIFGVFLVPWFYRLYKESHKKWNAPIIAGLIIAGFIYLLIHPVSNAYSPELMRGGALWLMTTYFPMVLSSSILFWIFFPAGLVLLYLLIQYHFAKQEYLIIVSLFLWLLFSMTSVRTYQRYYEPFLLFVIAYSFVRFSIDRWYEKGGLLLLGAFLLAMTTYNYALPIFF